MCLASRLVQHFDWNLEVIAISKSQNHCCMYSLKKIRLLRQFEYIIRKLGTYVNYMNSNLSRAYYCSKYHKKQLLFVQKCQTYWLDQLLHNIRSYFVQLRKNSELRSKLFLSLRWYLRKNGHLLRFLI